VPAVRADDGEIGPDRCSRRANGLTGYPEHDMHVILDYTHAHTELVQAGACADFCLLLEVEHRLGE